MVLNMGQLLSIPFILLGIGLIVYAMMRPRQQLTFPNRFADADGDQPAKNVAETSPLRGKSLNLHSIKRILNRSYTMIDKINQLKAEIEALEAKTPRGCGSPPHQVSQQKGAVSELMADFRNVPAEQKRELGQKLNELKNLATDRLNALREALETADNTAADIDLSRTAAPMPSEPAIRSRLSATKSSRSSRVSASPLPKVRKSKMTGTCSLRSTLPKTIPHVTCRTLSSSSATPTCSCAPTPHPCRAA